MVNSEQILDKPAVQTGSGIPARPGDNLDHSVASDTIVSQGAGALTRDWLASQGPSDLSAMTKAKVVLEAAAVGTVQNGLDEICNHPGRAAGELMGAVALGVALRGPVWTRMPAMAFATVGTLSYGKQLAEAGIATTNILDNMRSSNLEESRQGLKETLGPVIFSTALMYAAGHASSEVAAKLPAEYPQLKVAQSLAIAKDHLNNMLGINGDGFPPGMAPAFAGGYGDAGVGSGLRLESIMPKPAVATDNIMQMSSMGGSSHFAGDGVFAKTSRGPQGEKIYQVDNIKPGTSVNIAHESGAHTIIKADGNVAIGFKNGDGRRLDMMQAISRLVMSEFADGTRHFRFNSELAPGLEVAGEGHTIKANLPGGHRLQMVNNDGAYHYFEHRDGSKTWVERNGRVVFQLPENGKVSQAKIPATLAHIRMFEHANGSKILNFLNEKGEPIPQKIEVPSAAQATEPQSAAFQNPSDLRAKMAARVAARQSTKINNQRTFVDESLVSGGGAGDAMHGSNNSQANMLITQHGHHAFRLGMSYDRVVARELAGVPGMYMRGNNLSAPADMGIAVLSDNWVIANFLDRLDTQDDVHHHDHW